MIASGEVCGFKDTEVSRKRHQPGSIAGCVGDIHHAVISRVRRINGKLDAAKQLFVRANLAKVRAPGKWFTTRYRQAYLAVHMVLLQGC